MAHQHATAREGTGFCDNPAVDLGVSIPDQSGALTASISVPRGGGGSLGALPSSGCWAGPLSRPSSDPAACFKGRLAGKRQVNMLLTFRNPSASGLIVP